MKEERLIITEVIQRTASVKSCRVGRQGRGLYTAGQFMCVSFDPERSCRRYLSFSSSPTEEGYFEFTKKLTQSDFSRRLARAQPGEELYIGYPLGQFILPAPEVKVAFLCGGIGITPVRSMCKYASDTGSGHDIALLYGNRSPGDIVFLEEFQRMQESYPRLRVRHVLGECPADFPCASGLITGEAIAQEIPDFAGRSFYLCGPPGMVAAMQKILTEELGMGAQQVVTENFTGYE